MTALIYSVLGFIVAIGLLTSIHEFGHFWMARKLGVKVLRFCIGFGKPLITWHDKRGTEYALAAIPLGGYVKMLDQNEGEVPQNEKHRAFNNKPVWARMLIIAAGPAFNLLFAIFAYWLVFMLGVTSIVPMLGDIPKGSVAALAGLKSGQEIVAIDDRQVSSWEEIAVELVSNIGDRSFINIKVLDPNSKQTSTHALKLSNWELNNNEENIIKNLGLEPLDPIPPVVAKVTPGMPAALAGLEAGDEILSLDGIKVASRTELMHVLLNTYDRGVHLLVKRQNETVSLLVTPSKKLLDGGAATGYIGIQFQELPWPEKLIRIQYLPAGEAFSKAVTRTKDYSILTLQFLRKMLTGQMSLQHVAGPISIAKFAGRTAASGLQYFLGFLALVSISLGVLNMLPIPILDGGHFMFCVIELVRGKALSIRAINIGNTLGFVVLGSFMILAMYNDLLKVLQ